MIQEIFSPAVLQAFKDVQRAAECGVTKKIRVDGKAKTIPYPFPSPTDWRDSWIYFLMLDRFNNPSAPPKATWNRIYDFRQGGTFKGVQQQLSYIASLGAKAIWLSPVLKNSKPDWRWSYHGYATQHFLAIDERFASDGTSTTAEKELIELIEEAHARGLYVILDIVINHAARVFDYVYDGGVKDVVTDVNLMNAPLGQEPPIEWLDGSGTAKETWKDTIPSTDVLSSDDAVWPKDLQRTTFFRRRGNKLSDAAAP